MPTQHIPSLSNSCNYEKEISKDFDLDNNCLFLQDDTFVELTNTNTNENVVFNINEYAAFYFKNVFENKDYVLIKSVDNREIAIDGYDETNLVVSNKNYFIFDKITEKLQQVGHFSHSFLTPSNIEFDEIEEYSNLDNAECEKLYFQRQKMLQEYFLDGKEEIVDISANFENLQLKDEKQIEKHLMTNLNSLAMDCKKDCGIS